MFLKVNLKAYSGPGGRDHSLPSHNTGCVQHSWCLGSMSKLDVVSGFWEITGQIRNKWFDSETTWTPEITPTPKAGSKNRLNIYIKVAAFFAFQTRSLPTDLKSLILH